MNDSKPILERPTKPSYLGKNGFQEGIDFGEDNVDERHLQDALDRHRMALFTLQEQGRPIPSFEEMEADLDKLDNVATVKEQIKELQEQQVDDLLRLYAFQADEYSVDAKDRYLSMDDTQYLEEGVVDPKLKESYDKRTQLYEEARLEAMYDRWNNHHSIVRYNNLSRIIALRKRIPELENQEAEARRAEAEARKRQEAMFPMSEADFNTKSKDIKLRAARFLVSEPAKQEKTLAEFGWAHRQVQPLKEEFVKNPSFAAEIRALVLSDQVSDPRKSRVGLA